MVKFFVGPKPPDPIELDLEKGPHKPSLDPEFSAKTGATECVVFRSIASNTKIKDPRFGSITVFDSFNNLFFRHGVKPEICKFFKEVGVYCPHKTAIRIARKFLSKPIRTPKNADLMSFQDCFMFDYFGKFSEFYSLDPNIHPTDSPEPFMKQAQTLIALCCSQKLCYHPGIKQRYRSKRIPQHDRTPEKYTSQFLLMTEAPRTKIEPNPILAKPSQITQFIMGFRIKESHQFSIPKMSKMSKITSPRITPQHSQILLDFLQIQPEISIQTSNQIRMSEFSKPDILYPTPPDSITTVFLDALLEKARKEAEKERLKQEKRPDPKNRILRGPCVIQFVYPSGVIVPARVRFSKSGEFALIEPDNNGVGAYYLVEAKRVPIDGGTYPLAKKHSEKWNHCPNGDALAEKIINEW